MGAPTLREMRLRMSAASQIRAISESETARSDNDVAHAEPSLEQKSEPFPAVRRRLPDERLAITHHFSIAGQEGYLTVGVYEDGLPGEIFITMAKQGSTISGLMDAFATVVSLALQHGVPLRVLCEKLSHMRFEPSGLSGNPKIGYAKSLMCLCHSRTGRSALPRMAETGGRLRWRERSAAGPAGEVVGDRGQTPL